MSTKNSGPPKRRSAVLLVKRAKHFNELVLGNNGDAEFLGLLVFTGIGSDVVIDQIGGLF